MKRLLMFAVAAALGSGCASTGAVPRPFPTPGSGPPAPPAVESAPSGTLPLPAHGAAIAQTALGLAGTPYRLGGSDPKGFDCSGLVQYVLARHGLGAPRVVDEQVQLGRRIGEDEIQPGDLIFFAVESRRASHVGIAIDGETFVHAPRTGQRVRVDQLNAPYWRQRYRQARRIEGLPSGGPMLSLGDEAP
jgi:cell wall-associated NlpC family hydrolase